MTDSNVPDKRHASGCNFKGSHMTDKLSLIETIAKQDIFSTFSRLMGTSGANAAFSEGGDFTVFAPTNDAFCKIPDKQMNALLQEPGQTALKALLSYHIVPERLLAASLGSKRIAPTVTGADIKFTDDSDGLKVNGSLVQSRNIEASNGVVHALDTVLPYDTERFTTGPLSAPLEFRPSATPPELVVPRLSAGKDDAKAAAK
jgi:uncharacterized surface protein with fasciclin (FAS1) repeats